MDIEINKEIRTDITLAVNDINEFIRMGKYNLFNNELQTMLDKYDKKYLLVIGCKYHKSFNREYLELPYTEITDKQLDAILITAQKMFIN